MVEARDGGDGRVILTYMSNATAVYVMLEAEGMIGWFDDNAFVMLANEEVVVTFTPRGGDNSAVTPELLQSSLRIRSLVDTYHKRMAVLKMALRR